LPSADSGRDAALQYLRDHNVLSLATCADNQPWVAPVFYAWRASALYFLSAPHTRHGQNMAANPQVSGSIQDDVASWSAIQGLQLSGGVSLLEGDDRQQAIDIYQAKFNLNADTAPPQILKALDKISWYRCDLQQLLFVDNSVSFGHRSEIDLASLHET